MGLSCGANIPVASVITPSGWVVAEKCDTDILDDVSLNQVIDALIVRNAAVWF